MVRRKFATTASKSSITAEKVAFFEGSVLSTR